MRADEPAEFCKDIVPMIQKNVTRDYINQLRYERLMAKAEKYAFVSKVLYSIWCIVGKSKEARDTFWKTRSIAEKYEARARKIKEGM